MLPSMRLYVAAVFVGGAGLAGVCWPAGLLACQPVRWLRGNCQTVAGELPDGYWNSPCPIHSVKTPGVAVTCLFNFNPLAKSGAC